MKQKYLLKGLIKNIPGIERIYNFHKHGGGDTASARYCYSIWLRHLVLAYKNGLSEMPKTIAELGPGHSIGVGIAALLSGVKKYHGLDLIRYSNAEINVGILHDLVDLFVNQAPIPDNEEFPLIEPRLDDYSFPGHIITTSTINTLIQGEIIAKIEEAIRDIDYNKTNETIVYEAPWNEVYVEKNSVDFIMSQTVLQHIDSIEDAYEKMDLWLKPNGMISHTIDLQSMLSADEWYGHWTYSDLEWKIVRGRKDYYINRLPLSAHLSFLQDHNFSIIYLTKKSELTIPNRKQLAKRFLQMTDEDLSTSICFLQAVK